MQKLLSVTVIFLCAWLMQSFIVPGQTQTTNSNIGQISKWQQSTWVNPWTGAQTLSSKKASLADAEIRWFYDKTWTWYPHLYYRIYVNGVLTINPNTSFNADGTLYVAPGSTIFFEIESDAREGSGVFAFVYDYTAGYEYLNLYSTDIDYASCTFTAQDGHSYEINGK